ncbi:FecR family protein [Maricaulis maris]|uniref:FecR family protein n=1 Tax=Maricaulis maris TaxID=74318 RepID=A0A495DNZ7_9PROT|nr:FecR domain-containing protein [Maricaulis maris]RKR03749.1 FecR family protein [Maricaulis maris]
MMPVDPTSDIHHDAAGWAIWLQAGAPFDPERQAALEAWLEVDPRHGEALSACLDLDAALEQMRFGGWAEDLIAEVEAELDHVAPAPRPAGIVAGLGWRPLALAASILLLLAVTPFLVGPLLVGTPTAPVEQVVAEAFSTERGEMQTRVLADGSTVTLNTGSRIEVSFSDRERRIVLPRGEALFEVSHDPSRPFIVAAGGYEVRAVGTAFNVYTRADGRTMVTVVEGIVQARDTVAQANPALLHAGDQVELAPGTPLPTPQRVDADLAVAWRSGRLVFDGRRLADVVDEFRRYGDIAVEFADPDVAEIAVSGVFDPRDSDAFFAALDRMGPVGIDRDVDRIRLYSSNE